MIFHFLGYHPLYSIIYKEGDTLKFTILTQPSFAEVIEIILAIFVVVQKMD